MSREVSGAFEHGSYQTLNGRHFGVGNVENFSDALIIKSTKVVPRGIENKSINMATTVLLRIS